MRKSLAVLTALVSLLLVAGAWCIALGARHRINPESAARLKAGMTMEQASDVLGAAPGVHSNAGKDEHVTYVTEPGGVVWWSDASREDLKALFEDPKNVGDRRFGLWISDDYAVIAEFKDDKLSYSRMLHKYIPPPRTVVDRIRRFFRI